MGIFTNPNNYRQNRVGFHYFPDSVHYREYDVQRWIPKLTDLGASWLVLQSEVERAIPEQFIHAVIDAQIEPIIQFNMSLTEPADLDTLDPILSAYSRWGMHAVELFNRPNMRSSWTASSWAQQNLVERFLDLFIPYAERLLMFGLSPIFPTLQPGGSYWDTVFLRSALESLSKRKQTAILDSLILSAYGWTGGRPLNWGAGGPERWPNARPYFSNPADQDQRGFRIFDWYLTICQAVLGKSCPVILFQAGIPEDPDTLKEGFWQPEEHTQTNLAIAKLLAGEKAVEPLDPEQELEQISPQLVACNFWLLSADMHSPYQSQCWYPEEGDALPVTSSWRSWIYDPHPDGKDTLPKEVPQRKDQVIPQEKTPNNHPVKHYLLLPSYDWGVSDWHLEVIRPFVKKYRPTIGFSTEEAALADQVTVIGNTQTFSDDVLDSLRLTGSIVDRISGDGTTIATLMAER